MTKQELYSDARARNPDITVDEAVSFFVHALKDPLNPLSCGPCMVGCMLVIQPDHDNVETLLKKYHAFWSTAISFLTAKRSAKDIETLDRQWGQCRCTAIDNNVAARLHLFVHSMVSWPDSYGPDGGLGVLVNTLIMLFTVTVNAVKAISVAKGRHPKMWPVSPRDLIPFGPETSVESIITLTRFMGDAYAFLLLPFLMRICRSLIIPAVISSPSVAEYTVERGLKICADISHARSAHNGPVDVAVVEQFCGDIQRITSFFHILSQCLPGQIRQFYVNHATDSFKFLSQAVKIIESPLIPSIYKAEMESYREFLAAHAGVLYELFYKDIRASGAHLHPTIRFAIDTLFQDLTSPAISAWELIRHARETHTCFALECTESLQSTGRMYQRCSGCLVVGYSSKECQKRAWKDPRVPHRDICKKLRQVVDAGKDHLGREDEERFVRDMMKAKITDSVLVDIIRWLNNLRSMLSTVDGSPAPGLEFYNEQGHPTLV